MSVQITRKCGYCGNNIIITNTNLDKVIFYGNKTYHRMCFINMCKKKLNTPRTQKAKWRNILNSINRIQNDTNKHFVKTLDKERLNNFIFEVYNIQVIPNNIYQKISDIISGKYKNLSNGIPINDLYDMWKKKIKYLDKVAYQNKCKNKSMTINQRLSYDLAILVNKYDSYLSWKRDKQICESEYVQNINSSQLYVNQRIKTNQTKQDDDANDLEDLVDDIFN